MKRILILVPTLMLLASCTESYRMNYQELNDRYESFQRDYYELEKEYYSLEHEFHDYKDEVDYNYIHRDEVHENYILEDDVLDFLKDIYDEEGDYVHKDRIEELINYYCW